MTKKSKGLGDTVAKLTKFTGIKSFVDKVNYTNDINGWCGALRL